MTPGDTTRDRVTDALRWARTRDPRARSVSGLAPMPGNSGMSFGFDVLDAAGSPMASFVVRLAPPGVRKQGNTDVLRQVPLLAVLDAAGAPVAPLVWWTVDPSWFGADAIVQRRLAGRPLNPYDRAAGPDEPGPLVQRAVRALAAIHSVDHAPLLSWSPPDQLAESVTFWLRLLHRAGRPDDVELGDRLHARLRATAPQHPVIGLVHGDFHTNNVLFDGRGEVEAVIDWELAGIGPQLLDVGWLTLLTEGRGFSPEQSARMAVHLPHGSVRRWYAEVTGREVGDFEWFVAYAAFRYACIATFNLRLHRTGRRVDPSYELLESSVPTLFRYGLQSVR